MSTRIDGQIASGNSPQSAANPNQLPALRDLQRVHADAIDRMFDGIAGQTLKHAPVATAGFGHALRADATGRQLPLSVQLHGQAAGMATPLVMSRDTAPVVNKATSAQLWTDHAVYATTQAGLRQGGIDQAGTALSAGIVQQLLGQSGITQDNRIFALGSQDLPALASLAGVRTELLTPSQWSAATHYVNSAGNAPHQADRLRMALDVLQMTQKLSNPPELSAREMKDQMKSLLGLPDKAFGKMSDSQIKAKYDEVLAAMQQPGRHEIKFAKRYRASFNVDANGQLSDIKCKRKGWLSGLFSGIGNFFKKLGRTLLTICSFIPIPWIAIPARIASAVISVVQAVKSKNILGVVSGVASAVVGGIGAIAGTALSGTAKLVSTVADTVAKAGRGVQAVANAVKSKNVLGVVSAAAGVVGGIAGGFANGAEGISNLAQKVSDWSQRVLVGSRVVVDFKEGKVVDAIVNGMSLASTVAGSIKDDNGNVKPLAQQIVDVTAKAQTYAGFGRDVLGIVQQAGSGDIAGALQHGASLANRADGELFASDTANANGAAKVSALLGYAAHGVTTIDRFKHGDVGDGLAMTSSLFENLVPQIAPNSGWTDNIARLLRDGSQVAGIVDDVAAGRIDAAFSKVPGLATSLSWNLSDAGILTAPVDWSSERAAPQVFESIRHWAGTFQSASALVALEYFGPALTGLGSQAMGLIATDDRKTPAVLQQVNVWLGHGADSWQVLQSFRDGDSYSDAARRALELGAGLLRDRQREHVRTTGRQVLDAAAPLEASIRSGDGERIVVDASGFVAMLLKEFGQRQPQPATTP